MNANDNIDQYKLFGDDPKGLFAWTEKWLHVPCTSLTCFRLTSDDNV